MPNLIQPAPTGRAKCRGCGERIAAGAIRFGEALPNPFAEGDLTQWFHLDCGAFKRPEPLLATLEASTEPPEDANRLMAEAKHGVAHRRLPRINGAERAPSGRAQCRSCKVGIEKGAWRINLVFYDEGRFMPSGSIHVSCALPYFETIEILPRLKRFSPGLTDEELKAIEEQLSAR